MDFVDGPVSVSVPATSANLGPGYDALGLALSLRDRVTARVAAGGLAIGVRGEGADTVPRDESHLVVRGMRALFGRHQPPGLELDCLNVVPHGRGLGSSAAAIVAGLTLARALLVDGAQRHGDEELFRLAAELEGHPDNVAAAVFGGLCVSGRTAPADEPSAFWAARAPVDPRISAVVFVAPHPVSTALARGLLPATVSHADAAANAGRAALLVAALAGQPRLLLEATRDLLHQDYRAPAMPETLELVHELRRDGVPAVVSGAGPTVLAFTLDGADGADAVDGADGADGAAAAPPGLAARCPAGWAVRHLRVDTAGVLVD